MVDIELGYVIMNKTEWKKTQQPMRTLENLEYGPQYFLPSGHRLKVINKIGKYRPTIFATDEYGNLFCNRIRKNTEFRILDKGE